jgi:hypothetical protein
MDKGFNLKLLAAIVTLMVISLSVFVLHYSSSFDAWMMVVLCFFLTFFIDFSLFREAGLVSKK